MPKKKNLTSKSNIQQVYQVTKTFQTLWNVEYLQTQTASAFERNNTVESPTYAAIKKLIGILWCGTTDNEIE